MWKVPLFDLNFDHREEAAVSAVMQTRWLTMGEQTKSFERQFSSFLGHNATSVAVSSATAALHMSLLALGIGLGDCLLYTSPSPRDRTRSRMPSSA